MELQLDRCRGRTRQSRRAEEQSDGPGRSRQRERKKERIGTKTVIIRELGLYDDDDRSGDGYATGM